MLIRIIRLAVLLTCISLPLLGANAEPAAPPATEARVAQLRALLESEQGAAILDLLGDPAVRAAVLQSTGATQPTKTGFSTAGEMMATTLTGIRTRLFGLATELTRLPGELAETWNRVRLELPGS